MSLGAKLSQLISEMNLFEPTTTTTPVEKVLSLIDLTLLSTEATAHDIHDLCIKANQHRVAAVCILPEHLPGLSVESPIKRATVVNFPMGNHPQQLVKDTIKRLVEHQQVDEIDYVFPYLDYLAHHKMNALDHCKHVYECCKQHGLTFKVILETGALPSMDVIYELSMDILNIGCDFLKTSTGKTSVGATIPAVFSILSAINDSNRACGVKVSGGIKTLEQANTYIQLTESMFNHNVNESCFRLGTSSLIDDIIKLKIDEHLTL